ncbi:MAG: tRNA (adenosine(37)-N6)-dimethylallyltransferase MiaA [bacterium]
MKKKVLLIVGPTAVGKTTVALEFAKHLPCEIISADSRQVYKYMDIGTAKPGAEERAAVRHHFIDIKYPDEPYSAGQFGEQARGCVDDILGRGNLPVVVGGSGLYLRGLVDGFHPPRIADAELKMRLQEEAREHGLPHLYSKLQQLDPETAARLHPTDSQRIMRALEVVELTGTPFSAFRQTEPVPANFEPVFVGLTMARSKLYQRIDRRVEQMLADGLLEEVRRLQDMGYGPGVTALRTVGYREALMYLREQLSYDEMVALIKQKSRNYAKRQLTWFRKESRIAWVHVERVQDVVEALLKTAVERGFASLNDARQRSHECNA